MLKLENKQRPKTVQIGRLKRQDYKIQVFLNLILDREKQHYIKDGAGAWPAQPVEHVTLDLGVVSSSPKLGTEFT